MVCGKCGTPVGAQDKFCKSCGAPVTAPVAPASKATPAKAKVSGTGIAGLVVCLLTGIQLFILNVPPFTMGMMTILVGPIAVMLGAGDVDEMFATGLLAGIGSFILLVAAIVSFAFDICGMRPSAKITSAKCRKFRILSAIMLLADALLTTLPVIWIVECVSDSEFLYVILVFTVLLAIAHMVLAIVTNSKDKKSAV
jgi:hypothetical protein